VEPHQLRYFVRVAELRHFTRAAEELAVAQPSLSQQVRKLERELGFDLFERGRPGVRLTGEGEAFLPYARAVLERLAEAATAADEIRGAERGRVILGVSPIAGARLLPILLRAVRAQLPSLVVETREAGLERLLELLERGEVDITMVLLPAADPELFCAEALAEDLVAVLPAEHPLAARDAVEVAELRGERLVLLTGEYGLRRRIEEECERAGFGPSVACESGEIGIIQGLVEAGLGLTILPESAVRSDLATFVRPLLSHGDRPQRRIGLAIRRDRYVPRAARRVFELAQELFTGSG
jgi:DNA-binding transcriptional LysR family regulator